MSKRLVRCIDFETTGLSAAQGAEVIEVGVTDIHYTDAQNIEIHYQGAWRCKPGCPIEIGAMAVHHIKDEDLEGCPHPQEVIEERAVSKFAFAYVAHNAKFEDQFWTPPKPWIDTLKLARRLFPDAKQHTNQYLRYMLHIDSEPDFDINNAMPPHAAGPDSYITAFLCRRFLRDHDIKQLVQMTHEPQLLQTVHFGKHRGKAWSEVDTGFLNYVLNNPQAEDDVKFTARFWLSKRQQQQPQQPRDEDFIVEP